MKKPDAINKKRRSFLSPAAKKEYQKWYQTYRVQEYERKKCFSKGCRNFLIPSRQRYCSNACRMRDSHITFFPKGRTLKAKST